MVNAAQSSIDRALRSVRRQKNESGMVWRTLRVFRGTTGAYQIYTKNGTFYFRCCQYWDRSRLPVPYLSMYT